MNAGTAVRERTAPTPSRRRAGWPHDLVLGIRLAVGGGRTSWARLVLGTVGVLAILALLAAKIRPLFWTLTVAFNVVGMADLILDYYHAIRVGLPALAGQLGATYAIPIIYVPLLMITHVVAFYLLLRPQPQEVRAFSGKHAIPS